MLVSEMIEMLEDLDPDLEVSLEFVDPDDGEAISFRNFDLDIEDDDEDEDVVVLRASIPEDEVEVEEVEE